MAGFKQHLTFGVISSILLMYIYQSLIFAPVVIISSILPDIDSGTSIPFKMYNILMLILGFFLLSIYQNFYVIPVILFLSLLPYITRHRGLFHSIPMAILLSMLTFTFSDDLKLSTAVLVGYLTHLILDEVHSIVKFKKSIGSALSIYKKNNIPGSILLYFLILIDFLYICDIV